jgi:beta-ureidopropionase / N-carbamoyl-L-amino-acid hydrolase
MVEINAERLLGDLRRIADFGRYRTGVHRPTFSPQDMEARQWLVDRMSDAGLAALIDGVGNVIGKTRAPGPKLLVGSHAETQNHAGWLDGILGVIYGIETARALRDSGVRKDIGIDVGAWADEETHFLQFLGSRSFIGNLAEEEIDRAVNKDDKTPLREALRRAGLDGRPREHLDPSRYRGYLEAHIEQGSYLDSAGLQIGIVTSIVGIWQYRLAFFGEQNHAGSTGMVRRKDAGVALTRLACMIEKRFPEVARERSVWTIGRIDLDPGAPSIIPGGATMLFQFRDDELGQLERFEKTLQELVDELNRMGPCRCEITVVDRALPKAMSPQFQEVLEAAAATHAPGNYVRMPSGAGHDAQILALRMPAGMMFIPSVDGISHHYSEDSREEDIVAGCRVFASAVEGILGS